MTQQPKLGVQTYIPADKVMELDKFVEQDKANGDSQASRNKLINEAVEMYIKARKEGQTA